MNKNQISGLFGIGFVFIVGSIIGWALISPIPGSEDIRWSCILVFLFGLICIGAVIYNLVNKKKR